ncbi:RraA family protein [Paracoccus shanxieyensis]|uniref:Putative 4-hydroxy-4-methyl-2-oxoglutarate aldolase n=1 Tax=Paracoccus shanxieyensis TaxID=2675752 RepID=A0A6L6J2V0_9RHOB|nr:dimethylmenaquinone methyltransferase [Paracoccus shanxieyensis]MTH65570.1 dimethylmenaquinone methyltransferase [Paracoccus shanxieyensis]MTH88634.1 dimethylmenaquinone methyltransferase [Paracoccus shanxieyensis]
MDGLLERWRRIPVPVVVDLAPESQIDIAIRPLRPAGLQHVLFGQAVTARCTPPDFGAVLRAIAVIQPGQVLVIDAAGESGWAMIGDVLGGHLHRIGAAGIVCDGAVRDTGNLVGMAGLSIYARHVNPRGPVGASGDQVNLPVTIGGCAVSPGDLLIGDDDGLAALTPAQMQRLIEPAEAKMQLEAEWIRRLAASEPIAQVFGL